MRRPHAALLAGSFVISFSAVFVRLADSDPFTVAFFRATYALPVLFLLWWRRRRADQRTNRERYFAAASGFFLAIDLIAWHAAIGYIGAGLSTLIANSQVLVVAAVSWVILKEEMKPAVLISIAVMLVGLAMMTGLGRQDTFGSRPGLGVVFGLISAFSYALFLMLWRQSNIKHAPTAGPLMEATAGAALTTLVAASIIGTGLDFTFSWPSHGWLLMLAFGNQVLGWLIIGYGLPRLPAIETSIVILCQPVITMFWAMLFFGERPSSLQMVGGGVVIAAVAVASFAGVRRIEEAPAQL